MNMNAATPFTLPAARVAPVAFRTAALRYLTPDMEAEIGAMMLRDSLAAKTAPRVPTAVKRAAASRRNLRRLEDRAKRRSDDQTGVAAAAGVKAAVAAQAAAAAKRKMFLRREAVALRADGWPKQNIMRELGIGHTTLVRLLAEAKA